MKAFTESKNIEKLSILGKYWCHALMQENFCILRTPEPPRSRTDKEHLTMRRNKREVHQSYFTEANNRQNSNGKRHESKEEITRGCFTKQAKQKQMKIEEETEQGKSHRGCFTKEQWEKNAPKHETMHGGYLVKGVSPWPNTNMIHKNFQWLISASMKLGRCMWKIVTKTQSGSFLQ